MNIESFPAYNNINLFDTDLSQINIKDPDTLYCRIKSNLQSLIDLYSVYDPYNPDINKLSNLLNKIYELHENCNLDIVEDYSDGY